MAFSGGSTTDCVALLIRESAWESIRPVETAGPYYKRWTAAIGTADWSELANGHWLPSLNLNGNRMESC